MKNLYWLAVSLNFIACVKNNSQTSVSIPAKTENAQKQEKTAANSAKISVKDKSYSAKISKNNKVDQSGIVVNNGIVEADASFQWEANQKLEKLLKHFGNNIPEYYGGAFINNSGGLEINLIGNVAKGKKEIIKIIGSENVQFNTQKYSYNQLKKIMDFLNDFARNPENKIYSKNIMSASLMEIEGYVEVGLKDNGPQKIQEFRKHVLNSPAIKFVQSGGLINQ